MTDSTVAGLYLEEVRERLAGCCKEVVTFVFPAGEENKNLKTVQALYETLILNHLDRKDLLVALGGGVVGDLVRLCGGNLSARCVIYPDTDRAFIPGGQQHWRKDRRRF
ncbi:MAG: hypothetical protein V8S98_03605 [Lachnospiraceae bacterium]